MKICAFRYCPSCRSPLKSRRGKLIRCLRCSFYFYINPAPCTAAVLSNPAGELLLVRRARPPKKGFWDLPGGFIESGEMAEESLQRELMEEINITVNDLHIFGTYTDTYRYKGILYHVLTLGYRGTISRSQVTHIRPDDDVSEIRFFLPRKLPIKNFAFKSMLPILQDAMRLS